MRAHWGVLLASVALAALLFGGCEKKKPAVPQAEAPSTVALALPSAPAVAAPGVLSAAKLVSDAEVASVIPAGAVRQHLAGVGSTANYDGLSFSPPGSGGLGLTLQWWKLSSAAEADDRYHKTLAGYPGAKATDEVGQHSFRATGFKRRAFAFVDDGTHSVVALTCGDDRCVGDAGDAKLVELAKSIQSRLGS